MRYAEWGGRPPVCLLLRSERFEDVHRVSTDSSQQCFCRTGGLASPLLPVAQCPASTFDNAASFGWLRPIFARSALVGALHSGESVQQLAA